MVVLKSSVSKYLILSKSSFDITGFCIDSFFACSGLISKRLNSGPRLRLMSVTISSLIPSSGGFVT